ncbi:hypothetical protein C8F01DRAFT_1107944 [Mycena amicta]|nr:hypothetical protein C8F01DRAFT_1107944 [Mycena amicta]
MPKALAGRQPLPQTSTDFNLPIPLSGSFIDDSSAGFQRFRRPSLLAPKGGLHSDARLHSPLAASFKPSSHRRRASQSTSSLDEYDNFWSDISPPSSSEVPTPPLGAPENPEDPRRSAPPLTPPRRSLSRSSDRSDRLKGRRLSFLATDSLPKPKPPRILNLLAESRTVENEFQSEAAFQRLLAAGVDLPRTPRTVADRGRYPEEAVQDDLFQREESASDDDDDAESTYHSVLHGSEPINIRTPAGSVAGSVNGDDMCISESPSLSAMDVDIPSGSPSLSSLSSMSISGWRSTPPPTTSAVRSNKRKFDERFDPYQNASKRRAVSPSLSHLRDSLPSSPKSRPNPRLPIAIPIMPGSTVSSATSSPTVGVGTAALFAMSRPGNAVSSPIMRPMGLASPILRPMSRRRGEEEEREIEGVGGLTLG